MSWLWDGGSVREGSGVPRAGQVVIATAGRDSGKRYLVVKVLDQRFVAVADGRSKSADNPKRKNLRHLAVTPHVVEELSELLQRGGRVTDSDIQQALAHIERLEGGSNTGGEGRRD